jgi:3-hydroxy acid dehydrogenase / malonic semialdehyde reductase
MNKTVMVTGATAGFGKATAVKFAKNGYNVIITGRRKVLLDQLENELHTVGKTDILSLCFDVRNKDEVESAVGALPENWKKIDILVNNAGLAVGMDHIQSGDTDDWDRMIDTNVKGLLYVTRAVAPLMVARNEGHIFNIGSIAGKEVYENGNAYCASKFAVGALSKAMRIDMVKNNIRVTLIAPGMAETEFSLVRFKGDEQKAKNVYKGFDALSADDIADLIYYCATLPERVCINEVEITPTQQASVNHSFRRAEG